MKLRYNNIGYLPGAFKRVLVTDGDYTSFSLLDTENQVVFTGLLVESGVWDHTGESVRVGDFSQWTIPGVYRIRVDDKIQSDFFPIGESTYGKQLQAAIQGFYFQRSGVEIPRKRLENGRGLRRIRMTPSLFTLPWSERVCGMLMAAGMMRGLREVYCQCWVRWQPDACL
jgi:hypothetical protein